MTEFVTLLLEGGKVWIGAIDHEFHITLVSDMTGKLSHSDLHIEFEYGDPGERLRRDTFRYAPQNNTVYWWSDPPDPDYVEEVSAYLENRFGVPRPKHKTISAVKAHTAKGLYDFQMAHGTHPSQQ
jgi:hypothetical protein